MSNTTEQKLSKLINTKTKIRNKIIELGVPVPSAAPFNVYPDYIELISDFESTTTDQDILMLADLIEDLGTGNYELKNYTEDDVQEVLDLINNIQEGDY